MNKLILFLIGCIAFLNIECKDKQTETVPYLSVKTDTVDFGSSAASKTIKVETNVDWNVISDAEWCDVVSHDKSLKISVLENPGLVVREAHVSLTYETLKVEVLVRQLGQQAALIFAQQAFAPKAVGEDYRVKVTTNAVWRVESPEWIVADSLLQASDSATTIFAFSVKANFEQERRNGEIIFREKGGNLESKITVSQKVMGDYESIDTEGLAKDIKVEVATGSASSFQSGAGIAKSFDGDKSTLYHSNWSNEGENYFPITLDYNFTNAEAIDYLIYYPRNDGSRNGFFKETEIWVQCEGEASPTKIMDKDFEGKGAAMYVNFPKTLVKPVKIRFIVKSGAGDGQGFASCAEMEFYRKSDTDFDPLTLFKDATCSSLRDGITTAEIDSCRFPFYRNIAMHMLAGTYPSEFRIQKYKAYPHPDESSRINKTSPYSKLDNPTGISVNSGEEVVILAGAMEGYSVSVGVQELDTPGKDGFGVTTYPLKEGANKIRMDKSGLLYIMYHTSEYESAPQVPIHIASGEVNGYFDITRHTANDWSRLISQAVNTHFDVVGRYAHLTFPVSALKSYTKNGYDLISLYDELVYQEQVFMGLEKYNRMFKNRMYLHVMYSNSYMYATSYHTAYAEGTLSDILNEGKLKTSACWGPAHEVGHCNQTRPGLKWLGTTEVTNNIHSLYIQTYWGNKSRLQNESLKSNGYTNRYEKAMTQTFTTGQGHAAEGDVFCKLVPFWQLELYLNKVKGKTDFYKDVYEEVRKNPNLPTPGEQQLEFVYTCCKIAGLDLLDFFSRWGFLKPVDLSLDDYGKGNLKVTQAQVDAIIRRVKELGHAKPDVSFEYITDATVEVYRNNAAVGMGQVTRTGNKLTMTGFTNVAAYEVYDADGQLIFVSPEVSFTLKKNWQEGFKVYAVAANGDKSEISF